MGWHRTYGGLEDWEKIDRGIVIKMADGRFVSEIMANGHPENPVIYFTEYLWEAKVWKTPKAALKARDRVQAKHGECRVWDFIYDAENRKREIIGCLERLEEARA